MRIGIYARVSTTDQHCEQQLHDLRQYAAARGWTIEAEYVDKMSGTKDTRPAMTRLMAAARRRAVDAVLVWKIDRWSRSMPAFVASVEELRSLDVRFIAVSQGIDTDASSPTGTLMLRLLGAFAEFERELIVERVRSGLARARREGRIGGRSRLVVNRGRIADLDAQGWTTREIGEEMGVSAATVCRILRTS